MKKSEEKEYEEYKLLFDILDEYRDKQYELEKTIKALKINPEYRSLFKKDYLQEKEKEKKKIDTIIEALNHFRDIQK